MLYCMDEELASVPSTTGRWSVKTQAWWAVVKRILPFAVVLVAVFSGVLLYVYLFPAPVPPSEDEINSIVAQAMASATPPPPDSALVYQYILPSVVLIQTKQESSGDNGEFGVGSGVVVNENGDILTAYHVIANATEIEVLFAEGTYAAAQVISADPDTDIAVLHPDRPPEVIVPAVLGNPGAMRVGDEAFAVGNPLGLAASMSAGVISGFDRSASVKETGQRLEGLIQFDTAVNPGSSGGPLLNRQGQVVGIVTALANPSEQSYFIGIGFAVPIGTAVAVGGGGPEY